MNRNGKVITDYELWPADRAVLQRIATHFGSPISPSKIEYRLTKGEKVTTKYGSVYSLVPIEAH